MGPQKAFFTLYLVVVVGALFALFEFVSLRINRSEGIDLPYLIRRGDSVETFRGGERFTAIDPHLGYGRGENEPAVVVFRERHVWRRGFAIYGDAPEGAPARPLILTLGGSTTDPLNHETSWPEELAAMLVERGLPGTVVNGAVGGYSTNQELLKLVRDGIELAPDLVISYSAVNDRGAYGPLPHPMVHAYQRQILANLTQSRLHRMLPNTVSLIQRWGGRDDDALGYSLGLETQRSLGEWYARNLSLMNAVARASGAEFLGVIQPNAYVGADAGAGRFLANGKSDEYVVALRDFYAQIVDVPERLHYVHSFIDIFDGAQGVYSEDGVHTLRAGDRLIAQAMLSLIERETSLFAGSGDH
ncbi:MAG: SGNH/GDSL hydrolase family protein [Myxococcota bacterium]